MSYTPRISATALALALLLPAVASADRRVDRPRVRVIVESGPVTVFADYRRSWVVVQPRIHYRVGSHRIVRGFGGAKFRHGGHDRRHHRAFKDRGLHLGWRNRDRHHAFKDRGRHLGWRHRDRHDARRFW